MAAPRRIAPLFASAVTTSQLKLSNNAALVQRAIASYDVVKDFPDQELAELRHIPGGRIACTTSRREDVLECVRDSRLVFASERGE